jgi:hypothetical protein
MNAVIALTLLTLGGGAAEEPPGGGPLRSVAAAVAEMQRAAAAFVDVTCTVRKTEYKGGQLPEEVALLKLRNRPRAVYMRWIGAAQRGREVLWREGWNGGRLRAHPGSFPDLTLNLAPTSWLAMRGSRHPVTQIGFDYILELLARDLAAVEATPACLVRAEELGAQTVGGAAARCYDVEMDKGRCPGLYGWRARFCMDDATRLPSRVQVWDREDGELRLVEEFIYEELRLDTGLTDADFDPDRYGF